MPNIPITQGYSPVRRATPGSPGPVPRADTSVYDNIAYLGGVLGKIGEEIMADQAKSDLGKAQADLTLLMNEHENNIAQSAVNDSTDFEAWKKGFTDKWTQTVRERAAKLAPIVRNSYEDWATRMAPAAQERINAAVYAKQRPYNRSTFEAKHLELLKAGQTKAAEALSSQYAQWYEPGEQEDVIEKQKKYTTLRSAESLAMVDPDRALGLIKGDRMIGYEMDPDEVRRVQGVAQAAKNQREYKEEQAKLALEKNVFDLIVKDTPLEEIINRVNQTVGISKYERDALIKKATDILAKKPADENDPLALAAVYQMLNTKANQQKKMDFLMSKRHLLKSTTLDGFVQDIWKPETVSNEIYKQYSQAIDNLKTGKMFSAETTQNINLSIKAHDLLRMFAEKNPDATEEEYAAFFNRLVENQAKWWAVLPGGRPWSGRRGKAEVRLSIPQNIETMRKEMAVPVGNDLSKLSDAELIKRITGQ